MININKVVLVGRLTKDPEVRKTSSGISVANFTVAVSRKMNLKDNQSNQPNADFINCVAWRQPADFIGAYGRKGTMVGIEGKIQTRSYDAQDGRKVYVTEVLCDTVELERRDGQTQSANTYNGGYQSSYQPQQTSYQQPSYQQQSYSQPSYNQTHDADVDDDGMDIMNNDLPF